MKSHQLEGKSRQEVVSLLGEPDEKFTIKLALPPFYARRDVEPEDQPPVDLTNLQSLETLYGRSVLANGVTVANALTFVAYDNGPVWLHFGFPMSSLGRAYPVGSYPFEDRSALVWRQEVDHWLRELGENVFPAVPFDCALIAHEPDVSVAQELAQGRIPARRWDGILVPTGGILAWFPPTEGAPFTWNQ